MRKTGRALLSLGLMVVVAFVVITALEWPLKTALFPIIIGVPVFFLLLSELLLNLFGREDIGEKANGMDVKFSEATDPSVASRRTRSMFLWIFGFFFLILFLGFPIAVPVFFVLFLRVHGKEKWTVSVGVSALAYASFFGLLVGLLHTPFQEGWVERWLRHLGVL